MAQQLQGTGPVLSTAAGQGIPGQAPPNDAGAAGSAEAAGRPAAGASAMLPGVFLVGRVLSELARGLAQCVCVQQGGPAGLAHQQQQQGEAKEKEQKQLQQLDASGSTQEPLAAVGSSGESASLHLCCRWMSDDDARVVLERVAAALSFAVQQTVYM